MAATLDAPAPRTKTKKPRPARARTYQHEGCSYLNPRACIANQLHAGIEWAIREVVRTDSVRDAAIVRRKRVGTFCTCLECTELMLRQIHGEVGTPRFALPGAARDKEMPRVRDLQSVYRMREQREALRDQEHAQSRLATIIRIAGPLPTEPRTRNNPNPATLPIDYDEADELASLVQWFEATKPRRIRWQEWQDKMLRVLHRYHVPEADDRKAIDVMRAAGEVVQPIVRDDRHMELWAMWVQKFVEETGQE